MMMMPNMIAKLSNQPQQRNSARGGTHGQEHAEEDRKDSGRDEPAFTFDLLAKTDGHGHFEHAAHDVPGGDAESATPNAVRPG